MEMKQLDTLIHSDYFGVEPTGSYSFLLDLRYKKKRYRNKSARWFSLPVTVAYRRAKLESARLAEQEALNRAAAKAEDEMIKQAQAGKQTWRSC